MCCLPDGLRAVETLFDLAPEATAPKTSFELAAAKRRCILFRLDGGFGTDDKLSLLLSRGYHVVAKGFSGRRADRLAQQVTRWNPYGDAWLGAVASPIDFGRPVQVWVKRYQTKKDDQYSYFLSSLKLHSLHDYMTLYDQRGATEIEQFRDDKQGLHLSYRRKHSMLAQQALVLAVDIAHNLLAHFYHHALADSPLAGYAAKRIVRDLLTMEGTLIWQDQKLVRVELCKDNPFAEKLLPCLERYFQTLKSAC